MTPKVRTLAKLKSRQAQFSRKEIESLVRSVKDREKKEGRIYPNLLGGREIDRMAGKPLNLEEWTTFHEIYGTLHRR